MPLQRWSSGSTRTPIKLAACTAPKMLRHQLCRCRARRPGSKCVCVRSSFACCPSLQRHFVCTCGCCFSPHCTRKLAACLAPRILRDQLCRCHARSPCVYVWCAQHLPSASLCLHLRMPLHLSLDTINQCHTEMYFINELQHQPSTLSSFHSLQLLHLCFFFILLPHILSCLFLFSGPERNVISNRSVTILTAAATSSITVPSSPSNSIGGFQFSTSSAFSFSFHFHEFPCSRLYCVRVGLFSFLLLRNVFCLLPAAGYESARHDVSRVGMKIGCPDQRVRVCVRITDG